MGKIIHWLIMPCEKVTCIIEKKQAGHLSFIDKWRLSVHFSICKICKLYNNKVILMDKVMKKLIKNEKEIDLKEFDIQNFKSKIKDGLKK